MTWSEYQRLRYDPRNETLYGALSQKGYNSKGLDEEESDKEPQPLCGPGPSGPVGTNRGTVSLTDGIEFPSDDEIEHPSHYNQSEIQPIDVIEKWELNYCLGNTLKYICRYKHKGTPLKDLRKARWYLDREIAKMESEDGI